MKTCEERYPIGTEVIITKDCRRLERATGKKGIIVKYIYYIIPNDVAKDFTNDIEDDEDLKGTMPVIKYGKLAKIRGDQCWWSSLEDYEKIKISMKMRRLKERS